MKSLLSLLLHELKKNRARRHDTTEIRLLDVAYLRTKDQEKAETEKAKADIARENAFQAEVNSLWKLTAAFAHTRSQKSQDRPSKKGKQPTRSISLLPSHSSDSDWMYDKTPQRLPRASYPLFSNINSAFEHIPKTPEQSSEIFVPPKPPPKTVRFNFGTPILAPLPIRPAHKNQMHSFQTPSSTSATSKSIQTPSIIETEPT